MKQPIHSFERTSPKDINFADLKDLFRPFFEKSPAIKAYLFGSRARGDAEAESDVDLVIVADTDRPFVERCRDFFGLFEACPAALEMLVYTPEEFRRMPDQDNPFLVKAMEEGRLLYERPGNDRNTAEDVGSIPPDLDDSKRFAGMTPEKKLQLSMKLYWEARELMAAGFRARKPDWTEEQIQEEVRKRFLHGFG
jgi:uncharacterized protein